MATSKSYQTLITLISAAVGAEIGLYLAGNHLVPPVDTALRTLDPAFAVLWIAAGVVLAGSALVAGLAGARIGQQIGRWTAPTTPARKADDATASLLPGIGATA